MPFEEEDWCKMWESIKTIELMLPMIQKPVAREIKIRIEMIKSQIQSVIGQME